MELSNPLHPSVRLRAIATALVFVGISTAVTSAAERPIVVATNTILADMVTQVAGPEVEVHCLVPAGVDIHGFEPKPGDVARLEECDIVISNGAGFEPWLEKLIAASGYKGPHLEASRGVALIQRNGGGDAHAHEHDHRHGHEDDHPHDGNGDDSHGHHAEGARGPAVDPHAWQNPANGIRYVLNIRGVLTQIAPELRSQIERRSQLYISQLEVTNAWMRRVIHSIPSERRVIVTSHDSFAYLGQTCGLEVIPVRGLDTRQEPDARRIATLVDELKSRKVRAIFVESISNPKMLQQLARDTGASIGGELHSDSLGHEGSGADSYLGLLRENTLTIVEALERR